MIASTYIEPGQVFSSTPIQGGLGAWSPLRSFTEASRGAPPTIPRLSHGPAAHEKPSTPSGETNGRTPRPSSGAHFARACETEPTTPHVFMAFRPRHPSQFSAPFPRRLLAASPSPSSGLRPSSPTAPNVLAQTLQARLPSVHAAVPPAPDAPHVIPSLPRKPLEGAVA